jgi:hypothetical protein
MLFVSKNARKQLICGFESKMIIMARDTGATSLT